MARYEDIKHLLKPGMTVKVIKNECCSIAEGQECVVGAKGQLFRGGSCVCSFLDERAAVELEILTDEYGNPWSESPSNPKDQCPKHLSTGLGECIGCAQDKSQILKAGDRVRILTAFFGTHLIGKTCSVTKVERGRFWVEGGDRSWDVEGDSYEKIEPSSSAETEAKPKQMLFGGARGTGRWSRMWIDEAGAERDFTKFYYGSWEPSEPTQSLTKKPTIMSSIAKKLKDLTLSKETRILRENGLEGECGITETAREMMLDEVIEARWKERREEIAKDLLKLKEEESKRH